MHEGQCYPRATASPLRPALLHFVIALTRSSGTLHHPYADWTPACTYPSPGIPGEGRVRVLFPRTRAKGLMVDSEAERLPRAIRQSRRPSPFQRTLTPPSPGIPGEGENLGSPGRACHPVSGARGPKHIEPEVRAAGSAAGFDSSPLHLSPSSFTKHRASVIPALPHADWASF